MDYILAIECVEKVMLDMKSKKEMVKICNLEKELNILLEHKKKIIIAYAKVALDNINHSTRKVTPKEMENQIQYLKDCYTPEKLIERANKL